MSPLVVKAITAWQLGVVSIARALWYRLAVKFGWNPVKKLVELPPVGPFYSACKVPAS